MAQVNEKAKEQAMAAERLATDKFEKCNADITAVYRLSNLQSYYNDAGQLLFRAYTNKSLSTVRIVPKFCKQLVINAKRIEEIPSIMADVSAFCSDVYNCVRAEGLVRNDGTRGVKLWFDNYTKFTVWALDEYRCPMLVNYEAQSKDWKRVRRLTLIKSDKMSHKLWATTDWFYKI